MHEQRGSLDETQRGCFRQQQPGTANRTNLHIVDLPILPKTGSGMTARPRR